MDATWADDIASSDDRSHVLDIVLVKALVRLYLGMNTHGVGAPLLLHEHQHVVVEAVGDPSLGTAADGRVSARDGLSDEKFLLSRGPCSPTSGGLEDLVALDLPEGH